MMFLLRKRNILTIVLLLSAILGGIKAYLDYRLPIELDKIVSKLPVTYANAYFTSLGAIKIDDVRLGTVPLRIKTLTLHQAYRFYNLQSLPRSIHLTARGIQLTVHASDSAPPPLLDMLGYAPYYVNGKALSNMGYTTFNANLTVTATQVTDDQHMINGMLDIQQSGKLTLDATLQTIPPPVKWTGKTFSTLTFKKLAVTYADTGFLQRVFSFLAQRHKTTVVAFKEALKTKVTTDIKQSGLPFDADHLRHLQHFIQTPRTLTLTLQPPNPFNLNQLWISLPSIKQLGLKIET